MSREIFGISTTFSGMAIKGLRKHLELSQVKFAEAIGCSPSTVQKWESDSVRPNLTAVAKMLELCEDDQTRALFIPLLRSSEPSLKSRLVQTYTGGEKEPEPAKHIHPDVRELRRRGSDALKVLLREKQAGNRAAGEALKVLAEESMRAAGIATSPESPRGRGGELDRTFLDSEKL